MDTQSKTQRDENKTDLTVRRAYTSPTLKRLGSVRELTLGSTGKVVDGGAQPTMM